MVAKIKLDQVGLSPPGEEDQSRSDGLADGSRMSAYSVDEHTTYKWEMLWAPLDDIAVVVVDSTGRLCYWDPQAAAYGEYNIRLTVDEGLPTQNVIDRTFGIRTPKKGILYPALNQDADPNASLVNAGPDRVRASTTNEPFGPFTGGSYAGWLMHYYELAAIVEDLSEGGIPTLENKQMAGRVTTSDGDLACDTPIAEAPVLDSHVTVRINGISVSVGDGVKTAFCYFSDDGGTSAKDIADITTGDLLYWNGNVANYQLTTLDEIEFDYDVGQTGGVGGSGCACSDLITQGEVNFWVRTDGDDNNSGTEAAPFASLERAYQSIPIIVTHPVIIHLGVHSGSGWPYVTLGQHLMRAPIIVIGDGAGSGDGFTELLSGAAEAGSSQYQISSSGLTLNAFRGKTILVTSGAATGDRRHVNYNDTGALYPNTPFTAAVATGDTFRVVGPAVNILLNDTFIEEKSPLVSGCGQADSFVTASRNNNKVWFVNVGIQTTVMSPLILSSSSVIFFGVELINDWVNLVYIKGSQLLLGREAEVFTVQSGGCPTAQALLGVPNYLSWDGWGLTSYGPTAFADGGSVFGTLIAPQLSVQGSDVTLIGGNIYENGLQAGPHVGWGEVKVEGRAAQTPFRVRSTTGSAFLSLEGGKMLVNGGSNAIVIDGALDHGFESRDGSEIRIAGSLTGNADKFGHFVEFGGLIDVHDGLPTATGTLGDITPDRGVSIYPNSSLVAGTAYVDAIHGRIQRGYH